MESFIRHLFNGNEAVWAAFNKLRYTECVTRNRISEQDKFLDTLRAAGFPNIAEHNRNRLYPSLWLDLPGRAQELTIYYGHYDADRYGDGVNYFTNVLDHITYNGEEFRECDINGWDAGTRQFVFDQCRTLVSLAEREGTETP